MRKILTILCIIFFIQNHLVAQSTAGSDAFAVFNIYNSAQMTARGLSFMPRFSSDASSSLTNPALMDSALNNKINITYTDLFAGSYQGSVAFTHTFDKIGNTGFGMQYVNYGKFTQTEANGDVVGSFSVSDLLLTMSWGLQVEKNIYMGITFKPLFSWYESYSSVTLAFDFGATYVSNSNDWQASLILKNAGRQIKTFNAEKDTVPFDIQVGVSKKLSHAPLIVYIVADNLTKWDIRENDKINPRDEISMDGSVRKENKFSAFLDKGFRHLQFAVDITPSDKWYISVGYSWKRRQEMKVDDAFSLAGLSYGLGIKWKKFTLNYARNEYHNYGSPNYITLGYTL